MNNQLKTVLEKGVLELEGQFLFGSNGVFLARLHHRGQELQAVYKPLQGEMRLWDFPHHTLALREVAAYLISRALGWNFVPTTVLREDAPYGSGSLQRLIRHDPGYHYFNFSAEDKARLRPVALFDLLVNNADRKGSHVMIERETRKLWLIDHGLCFHRDDKLRTVIWDFAGEDIPPALLDDLKRLRAALARDLSLSAELTHYLSPAEIAALQARAERLLREGVFSFPPEDRRAFPYPPL